VTDWIAEASPRFKARMAGIFELLEGLTSTFGQVVVLGGFIVSGNAAATAANILGHERLFWWGFASSLAGVMLHIAWTLLFFNLLKPVSRSVSLLAAFVMLVGCTVQAVTCLLYVAPWLVLTGGSSLSALTTDQLQALAIVFIELNAYSFDIYLVFFGFWCILTGYLISRSTFLPRILGVLPLPAVGNPPVPLHRGRRRRRRIAAATVAHRVWRKQSTMEGAGRCSRTAAQIALSGIDRARRSFTCASRSA
jgi:Domain of unknown function (DUF4386)